MRNTPFRVAPAVVALLAALVCAPAAAGDSGAMPKPTREILVPFEDLHVLLDQNTHRVLLTRKEYDDLLARARKGAEVRAPRSAVLLSADYSVKVSDERAVILGNLVVEVLDDGLQEIGLELGNVGLRNASLDAKGAPIGLADDGRLTLFVEGKGRHALVLEMVAELQTNTARQILDFQLPTPAATRLRLSIPGDVELKSGAPVVSRVFDDKAAETRIELLPASGRVSLVMTLNSRLKRHDRVVVARSVMVDEVTQAYDRLHATFSMDVLHRAVDTFRFTVPDGFEVTDVRSPQLARWAVSVEGAARVLEVRLREEASGPVLIGLSAIRMNPDLSAWRLPQFVPLDVVGHTAVVGLLLEDRLKLEALAPTGLIPIDASILRRALPVTVLEVQPGAAAIRPVAAFYAAQTGFDLAARFPKPPAKMLVTTNVLLIVEDSGLQVRGGFSILPEEEKVFSVDVPIPAGWVVTSVTAEDGAKLPYETYDVPDGPGRVHVNFPTGVAPGREQRFYLHALRTPPGWLDNWTAQSVDFPVLALAGAARDVGAIAVDARDDMTVRPDKLDRLTPLDENQMAKYGLSGVPANLAYRYELQPYSASIAVERIRPRLTAQTYSFLRIERDSLVAHYELVYNVAEARTRELALLLPRSTPAELSISGLDGVKIKEFAGALVGDTRRWTVILADRRSGPVKLAVDFTQKLSDADAKNFDLPLVRADGVAYQSGLVAVEGSAELDVKLSTDQRKVDIGELVDAAYQPGSRLLGVSSFVGEPKGVKVAVSRDPLYSLPPAIVERAVFSTILSADGVAETEARFRLRTKALFLEVKLPAGSTLWSAILDGSPTKPQREGDLLLLNLPAADEGAPRELIVLYETPVKTIRFWTGLGVPAPALYLHAADQAASQPIPVADLVWHLYLPTGYRVVRSAGSVVTDQPQLPPLAASHVLSLAWEATGGVKPQYSPFLAAASSARHRTPGVSAGFSAVPRSPQAIRAAEDESMSLQTDFLTAGGSLEGTGQAGGKSTTQHGGDTTITFGAESIRVPAKPATPALVMGKGIPVLGNILVTDKLEGFRSLAIELQRQGERITFMSLGSEPRLDVTVIGVQRVKSLAWALALVVLLGGIAMTGRSLARKVAYILVVALLATLIPVITGLTELALLLNGAFYAACLLVPYYLLAGFVRWFLSKVRPRAAVTALTIIFALVLGFAPASAQAQQKDGPYVVQVVGPERPVTVPDDAIVVPYDPESRTGVPDATRLLVPYDRFVELWNLAYPDKRIAVATAPVPFAFSGASFRARLQGDDFLLVEGAVDITTYSDGYVTVPLALEGAVLAKADLDGKPAKLSIPQIQLMEPRPVPSQSARQSAEVMRARPFVVLYVAGKGRHRLDLAVRMKLDRQGGWRSAQGRLPAAPATALTLEIPDALTEVRLGSVSDRKTYQTSAASQKIETALGIDGQFSVQWRPKVQEGATDLSLTADSSAVFDVQEDQLKLVWSLALSFRKGEREFFTVEVPPGYLVEKVTGSNVRGWDIKQADGAQTREIALLKKAKETEQFDVHLWKPGSVTTGAFAEFSVPVVGVAGAVRQGGILLIRRSPLLDVRTVDTTGLTRTDLPTAPPRTTLGAVTDESPLGLRPYQAFRFIATPFSLKLSAAPVAPFATARLQTILRVADRERKLESRVAFTVQKRPLYRLRVAVPSDLKIDRVSAPGDFEWALTDESGRKILSLYLAAGVQGEFPVVVRGSLGEEKSLRVVDLPVLEVLDVVSQQCDIAVQVDPAFDVATAKLVNVESVLVGNLNAWMSADQITFARLALHCKAPAYSGQLLLTERKPAVTCDTIANVLVTERSISESILLNFTIVNAGVREVSFLLPAWMKDARVSVPLLRQKTVEPVKIDGVDYVRVRVQLQDEIMNQLRVLVENDRVLTADEQLAPIVVVETGRTLNRYIVLESAGRDEVELKAADGLEPVGRQEKVWSALAQFMRKGVTQAWSVSDTAKAPRLVFKMKQRKLVETAEARIGLAHTLLVLDAGGAYRGVQTYKLHNSIEQFLEIVLPEGASAWTVRVAGEPVKPTQVPGGEANHLRIPLVKTAEGDLDYEVVVKYGGSLAPVSSLRNVAMPLIRTVKIECELSQVELRLPESFRWFSFGGTMREVRDEAEFQAGVVSYLNKEAQRLVETSRSSVNPYAKARAEANWDDVAGQITIMQEKAEYGGNEIYQKEVSSAQNTLRAKTAQPKAPIDDGIELSNRKVMGELYDQQDNSRSFNQVQRLKDNFSEADGRTVMRSDAVQSDVNSAWLANKGLENTDGDKGGLAQPGPGQSKGKDAQGDRLSRSKGSKKSEQPAAPDVAKSDLGWKGYIDKKQQLSQSVPSEDSQSVERYSQKQQAAKRTGQTNAPDGWRADGGSYFRTGTGTQSFEGPQFALGSIGGQSEETRVHDVTDLMGTPADVESGLASLDVEIPERGVLYRFTTPRSGIEINARAISAKFIDSLKPLGIVILALGLVGLVRWLDVRRWKFSLKAQSTISSLLIIFAPLGLLLGILPILAVVALVAAIAWKIVLRRTRKRLAAA